MLSPDKKNMHMPLLVMFIFLCFACRAQENPDRSQSAIDPVILCFHTAKIDLTVLGTIGAAHARNPQFSWVFFNKLLQQSSPELLLVQIRPEHLNKNELFDGAPEMAYLAYIAGKMKIECRGFDWWLDAQVVHWDLVSPDVRMSYMYKNIRSALDSAQAQMIILALEISLVEPLRTYLAQDGFREWSCPQGQIVLTNYPDLPAEILDVFRDGVAYLASLPYGGAAPIQRKIKDLNDIIRGKGYLFKR